MRKGDEEHGPWINESYGYLFIDAEAFPRMRDATVEARKIASDMMGWDKVGRPHKVNELMCDEHESEAHESDESRSCQMRRAVWRYEADEL